jgi:hypothetical protein
MSLTRKMLRGLSWAKKLRPGAVAAAVAVAADAASAADAAGVAVAVAAVAVAAASPGAYLAVVATPVRRVNALTALMTTSDEGRALFDPALFPVCGVFLLAAWRYRKSGERCQRVVITGIDRLWREPDNPET